MNGRRTWPFWVGGSALAFAGVLVARVVAPGQAGGRQALVFVVGVTVAILGLFVITLGTRRS